MFLEQSNLAAPGRDRLSSEVHPAYQRTLVVESRRNPRRDMRFCESGDRLASRGDSDVTFLIRHSGGRRDGSRDACEHRANAGGFLTGTCQY
jgi:hypothetical protein